MITPELSLGAILFDLGGVLIHVDPFRGARRLVPFTEKREEEIVAWFCEAAPVRAYELGLIDDETFYRESLAALKGRYNFSQFQEAWTDLFTPNNLMVRLLEPLSERYSLYALSNTNRMHAAFLEARYPFFRFFKKAYYSCALHLRKPDSAIYRAVLSDLGLPGPACVLIDDRPDNVEGASRCGIKAYRYLEGTLLLSSLGAEAPLRVEELFALKSHGEGIVGADAG